MEQRRAPTKLRLGIVGWRSKPKRQPLLIHQHGWTTAPNHKRNPLRVWLRACLKSSRRRQKARLLRVPGRKNQENWTQAALPQPPPPPHYRHPGKHCAKHSQRHIDRLGHLGAFDVQTPTPQRALIASQPVEKS